MLTSTSAPLPEPLGSLTLAQFRARAAANRPVFFFNIPGDKDESDSPKISSGIMTPRIDPNGLPGILGYGPLPRYIKDDDLLISVPYRKSIMSFFAVPDTPAILAQFTHTYRLLPPASPDSAPISEKALLVVLPEIPAEVGEKNVCLGVILREGTSEMRVMRVARNWFRETPHVILSDDSMESDTELDLGKWPLNAVAKAILKISGLCVARWSGQWLPEHDKVRHRRARALFAIKMPDQTNTESNEPPF